MISFYLFILGAGGKLEKPAAKPAAVKGNVSSSLELEKQVSKTFLHEYICKYIFRNILHVSITNPVDVFSSYL